MILYFGMLIATAFSWIKEETTVANLAGVKAAMRGEDPVALWVSALSSSLLIILLFAVPLISASRVTGRWRRLISRMNAPLVWTADRRNEQELFCRYLERSSIAYTAYIGPMEVRIPHGMGLLVLSILATVMAIVHLSRETVSHHFEKCKVTTVASPRSSCFVTSFASRPSQF